MADGKIIKLHPPQNVGTLNGSGMIVDATGNAFVFHTPRDNNSLVISEGQDVTFTTDANGKITSLSTTGDNPLGGS